MKIASAKSVFAIAFITAPFGAIGLPGTSVYAQDSTAKKIKQQKQELLRQQRQLERNRQELNAQRRQLNGSERPPVPAVSHGIFGDCPLGFTYYLIGGCKPDHAVIIYNGGSLDGRYPPQD